MHCTNCGNPIVPGTQYCTKCGTKIQTKDQTKESRSKKKIVFLTLGIVVLALSLGGNILLWQAYSTEYDRANATQTVSSAASDVQAGLCSKVGDYAVSEHDLSSEMFRMLGDCYGGLPPRESDFDRLSEKVVQVTSDWSSIQDYVNSISGSGSGSTTTN